MVGIYGEYFSSKNFKNGESIETKLTKTLLTILPNQFYKISIKKFKKKFIAW